MQDFVFLCLKAFQLVKGCCPCCSLANPVAYWALRYHMYIHNKNNLLFSVECSPQKHKDKQMYRNKAKDTVTENRHRKHEGNTEKSL